MISNFLFTSGPEAVGYGFGYMLGTFLGMLAMAVVVLVGGLIGAVFVQWGARLVARFKPSYGTAYKATIIAGLLISIVNLIYGILGGPPFPDDLAGFSTSQWRAWHGIVTISGFLAGGWVYGKQIKNPEGDPMGFGNGVLVALLQGVLGLALLFLMVGGIGILMAVLK